MTANERGSEADVVHERFPERGAIANEAARQLTSKLQQVSRTFLFFDNLVFWLP